MNFGSSYGVFCFIINTHKRFNIKKPISIKEFKNLILEFIEKNFKGNENYKKIVKGSAFCSEDDRIISDNYKITKDQRIGIIPPIGGG